MLNQILNQNIWWQNKSLINHDPKIRDLNAQRFRWRPPALEEFDLDHFAVYTLRGPRQVGKTTALKILINDLLQDEGVLKEQVMYYTCDNIDDYKELIELIETYLDHIKKLGLQKKRLYIFLDEVTSVRDWQKGIKYLVDTGKLSHAGMALTGSNAADLRKGMERLPGRRGKIESPDKIMLPLTFRDYVSLINPGLFERFTERLEGGMDIFTLDQTAFKTLLSLRPHLGELAIL